MPLIPRNIKLLIPCYNGGESAVEFLNSLKNKVDPSRVLLIDDGSEPKFNSFLKTLPYKLFSFKVNQGKGAALRSGLIQLASEVDWVITLDCDGQHAIDSVIDFLPTLNEQASGIVVGARSFKLDEMPWSRVFSNRVSTWMVNKIARSQVFDAQSGFRAYHSTLCSNDLLPEPSRFQWESEVLIKVARSGAEISKVKIPTIYGDETSNISHVDDTIRFLKMLRRCQKER